MVALVIVVVIVAVFVVVVVLDVVLVVLVTVVDVLGTVVDVEVVVVNNVVEGSFSSWSSRLVSIDSFPPKKIKYERPDIAIKRINNKVNLELVVII